MYVRTYFLIWCICYSLAIDAPQVWWVTYGGFADRWRAATKKSTRHLTLRNSSCNDICHSIFLWWGARMYDVIYSYSTREEASNSCSYGKYGVSGSMRCLISSKTCMKHWCISSFAMYGNGRNRQGSCIDTINWHYKEYVFHRCITRCNCILDSYYFCIHFYFFFLEHACTLEKNCYYCSNYSCCLSYRVVYQKT